MGLRMLQFPQCAFDVSQFRIKSAAKGAVLAAAALVERLLEYASRVLEPMFPFCLATVLQQRIGSELLHGKKPTINAPIPISYSLFADPCLTMDAMPYYLFKTEPDAYSFDDFLRDKETTWDGVTNPTAVKNLREMPKGTKWIFYHTGDERRAVGTGTVTSVDASDPKVPVVRVKVGKRLKRPKTLDQIKAEPLFKDSPLVRIGRLSVVPLTAEQWGWFLA